MMAVCKDFQRQRAASLVSANRKASVGDSTWPSQKAKLAWQATEWQKKVAHGATVGFAVK